MLQFLTFSLVFVTVVKTESLKEIQYTPNTPLYDLIFSEKFPPSVPVLNKGRTSLTKSDKDKLKYTIIDENLNEVDSNDAPIFVINKTKPTHVFNFKTKKAEKKAEDSTIQKILYFGQNMRLALVDCKLIDYALIMN